MTIRFCLAAALLVFGVLALWLSLCWYLTDKLRIAARWRLKNLRKEGYLMPNHHHPECKRAYPDCPCNSCAIDANDYGPLCCAEHAGPSELCPLLSCKDYIKEGTR